MLDLKAAVYHTELEAKSGTEKPRTKVGGGKIDPTWAKQNVGIQQRNSRDMALTGSEAQTAAMMLARKAELYDKLKSGQVTGVSEHVLYVFFSLLLSTMMQRAEF
jgi:hypothetical protein